MCLRQDKCGLVPGECVDALANVSRRSGSRERSRERRRSRSRERREKKNKRDRSRDRSRGREGLDDKPADDNSIAAQAAAAVKALMKNKNKEMGGVCLDPAALKLAKRLIIVDLPLGTGASMLKSIIGMLFEPDMSTCALLFCLSVFTEI